MSAISALRRRHTMTYLMLGIAASGEGRDWFRSLSEVRIRISNPPWHSPDREKTAMSAFDPTRTSAAARQWHHRTRHDSGGNAYIAFGGARLAAPFSPDGRTLAVSSEDKPSEATARKPLDGKRN
jgi:hypothetical protein